MATKISFIKASPLTNVRGRIDYISNPKRQEHLMGFYQTPEDPSAFWKALSDTTKAHKAYHKKATKHVEAREHIVTLPYELADEDPALLAQKFAEDFKKEHGVDCAAAIHWNRKRSTLHLHLVFSERRLQQEKVSIAGRDTYFDADGKRSTKAKCVGADRNLLPGCRVVRKGEAFPSKLFAGKDGQFYMPSFLKAEKERYAAIFSELSNDEWVVYNHQTNPHLSLLNLVNGEPEGLRAWKERENEKRRHYNAAIDAMIDAGKLTPEAALEMKKQIYAEQIDQRKAREEEREAWKVYLDAASKRRADWRARKNAEWNKMHYNALGLRRSTFELIVILGLTIAGVDLFKNGEDDGFVMPPHPEVKIKADPHLQEMVDRLCVAAGRKTPAELVADRKVQRMADALDRKPSLDEQIGRADDKKVNGSPDGNLPLQKRESR